MGWQNNPNQHWRGDIGRLELSKDSKLSINSVTPLMSSDIEDPVSLSYPWVIKEERLYKMWYGSTICWEAGNKEMLHVIKYATSLDGSHWEKKVLPFHMSLGKPRLFRVQQ